MRQRTTIAGITLYAALYPLAGKSEMAPEELAVRAIYSQFLIAARVSEFRNEHMLQPAPARPLLIALSHFRTGPISAIRAEPIKGWVTTPSGEVVWSTPAGWGLNGQHLYTALAIEGWRPLTVRYAGVETQDWSSPLSALVAGKGVGRFAAYEVEVTLEGRSRRYKALTFFPSRERSRGTPFVVDYVLEGATLATLSETNAKEDLAALPKVLSPEVYPTATALVESLRAPAGCLVDARTQLCCNTRSGRCGIRPRE